MNSFFSEEVETESCASSETMLSSIKQESTDESDEMEDYEPVDSVSVFHGFVPGQDFTPPAKKIRLEDEVRLIPSGVRIVGSKEAFVKLERVEFACKTCGQAFESESARDAHAKKIITISITSR